MYKKPEPIPIKRINRNVVIVKEYSNGKKAENTQACFNYESALEVFQNNVAKVMLKILKANPKHLVSDMQKSHDVFTAKSTDTLNNGSQVSCTITITIE